MSHRSRRLVLAAALLALVALPACVTVPNGPDIVVIPGTGKSFEHFRSDDAICRDFGTWSIAGMTPGQAGSQGAVKSALTGAVVGAAAGVAFGGAEGAAIGAGSGLLVGSAAGLGANGYGSAVMQSRYDTAYMQCMYTKGNRVPVPAAAAAPSHPAPYPPPPPGYPRPPGPLSRTPPPPTR